MRLSRVILVLACCLLAAPTFAQITNVIPGAQDIDPCGATGTTLSGTGNPPPSYQLSKPCTTATVAFAFADAVSPLEGTGTMSQLLSLGFDVQNGTLCTAGSPRFNINFNGNTQAVIGLGCASGGTQVDLGTGWTRVTFNTAQIAAAVSSAGALPTTTIDDLYIILDEQGTSVVDNVMINGFTFGAAPIIAPVPTLHQWTLLALAATLALAGVFLLRK